MAEIDIKLKGLREIRQELRSLQFELSQATDPEQMAELSARAGELTDNLNRANEQARVFAAGSPFEQTSNALGLMNSQLMSLDFEGAAESAKLFATAAKGISPQLIATQLKSLGSVIGQVTKAFISMGASLLANPIFLIGAAIAALVAIIGVLLDKLGFLEPILDAIGAVFESIKWGIDLAVQSIKDFLDYLGLTNYAAQDFAAKQQEAAQKVIDKTKELEETIGSKYDQEIRLARIAGEDTSAMEIKKQKAIIATANIRLKAIDAIIKQNEVTKKLSEEELDKLRELQKETNKLIKGANNEIEAINATTAKNQKDARDKEREENKRNYEKMLADRKKYEQDRLAIARQIKDLELDLLEDGIQKELALNTEKYRRLLEDTARNETLNAEERQRLTELLKQQEFESTKEIELKYAEELAQALKDAEQARKEQEEQDRINELEKNKEWGSILNNAWTEVNKEDLDNYNKYVEAKAGLQDTLIGSFKNLESSLAAAGVKTAGLQKVLALVDIATNTAKSISAVVAGATAAATASGPAAPFVLAGYIASGIASVASAIASAYAALKSAPPIGGSTGGGGGVSTALSAASASAQTPSFQLFGQNNNANNLSASQSAESGQSEIVVKAIVSETEITGTQNKIKKMQESAAL